MGIFYTSHFLNETMYSFKVKHLKKKLQINEAKEEKLKKSQKNTDARQR